MEMLFRSTATDLLVISIVGMKGIGKTTLAQMVYSDDTVRTTFEARAWVLCVSKKSDEMELLQKEMATKKFLIVLDGLWNDRASDWERFIRHSKPRNGSRVIVTTTSKHAAEVVSSCSGLCHEMGLLRDEDCLPLMFRAAKISPHNQVNNLEDVALQLVKKCGGLPLAVSALGGLLCRKEATREAWEDVLNNQIWCLEEDEVLLVLRLCYFDLPAELKRMFAYCAIFPENHEFEKEHLVNLWIAEGLLDQHHPEREEWGCECFDELLSRAFFQHSYMEKKTVVMHDLVRELAQFVSQGACYLLKESVPQEHHRIPETTRHCSVSRY